MSGTVNGRNRVFVTVLAMLATPCLSGGGPAAAQDAFQDFLNKDRKAFEQFRQGESPRPAKVRPHVRPHDQLEGGAVLISQQLEPSDQPQTLRSVQDRITVTVPAGALTEPTTLTVLDIATNSPVPIWGLSYRTLDAIELDLAPARTLAKPLTIDVRYNPADLNPNVSPAGQIRGARWDPDGGQWVWLPMAGVDADRGRAAVACSQTGLVRWVSTAFDVRLRQTDPAQRASPIIVGAIVLGGLGYIYQRREDIQAAYEYCVRDTLQNSAGNFIVLCDEADIRKALVVGDAAWHPTNSAYTAALPKFVTDLTRYADESLAAYTNAGLPCPSLPISIQLDSSLILSRPDPGFYEWVSASIHLKTRPGNPMNHALLRHRIAHEVFHAVQASTIGKAWFFADKPNPYLWWMEACAEYASCRIPWRLAELGGKGDVYPRLLEYPLPPTGQLPRPPLPSGQTPVQGKFGDLEYDKGMFIDYLSQQPGFNFRKMIESAKTALSSSGSLPGALDSYLTSETGQGLAYHYRRFAHWFVFSSDTGSNADFPSAAATWSDTLPPYLANPSFPPPAAVSWSCKVDPPFAAHLWQVAISPDPDRDQWITVSAGNVTGKALVDILVADPDVRTPGQPVPVALLEKTGDAFLIRVPTNQYLFVMVSNPTETFQAAAQVWAGMSPPLESTHEFLPPHAEAVKIQLTLPWITPNELPANVNGFRVFVQRAVPRDPNDPSSPCNLEVDMITNVLLQADVAEQTLSLKDWGSRIGKVGLAIETRQETGRSGREEPGVAISPIYWGKQNPSTWRDYWDTAGTRLRRQYQYLVDWGGMRMPDGLETRWYENGQKEIEGQRKWTAYVGLWRRWGTNGQPADELEFVKNPNSGPLGERQGRYRGWNLEGRLVVDGQYDRCRKTGAWKYWYDNGRLSSEGSYRYDDAWPSEPASLFNLPFEERTFAEGRYQQVGAMVGRWTFYYDNGNRQSERTYDAEGELDGKESTWYASGRPERQCDYVHGKLVPDSSQYWEDK